MRKKILIKAPLLSRSGYGEQSRIALRALKTREDLFDIYVMNIPWGRTGHIAISDNGEREWIDKTLQRTIAYIQSGAQFDISFQISIPNEFEKIAPVNIGFTAGIETNKIAPEWIGKCNEVIDKVITISQHSRKGFEETSYDIKHPDTGQEITGWRMEKPVEVINYPVYKHEPSPIDIEFTTTNNFLCVSQWGPRKNLDNTIRWFVEHFKDDPDAGLVLKSNSMSDCIADRELTSARLTQLLAPYSDKKCKVYLIHGELTSGQLTWLYQHDSMKALINIAHGEGYGLPLFEAAYNGLPLITVTWSGQMDFICKPNKKGKRVPLVARVDYDLKEVQPEAVWDGVVTKESQWAYAKEASYKRALSEVLQKEKHFKDKAKTLQKYIIANFTEEKIYHQFVEAAYGAPLPAQIDVEDLPKISLITSVYDAAEHIEQLMEDVTEQTIFEDKCEWIILNVNKEGDDAEEEVILRYVDLFPDNIVYKRVKKDPGVYGIWNKALKMSTGEFVTNINCDDRRREDAIEQQAKFLLNDPGIDLVYNDSYVVQEPNVRWKDVVASSAQRYNFEQFSVEAMLRGNLPHNNPMWRKSLHDKHGYFESRYRSAGDWEYWLRCASAGVQFRKHPEILGVYYFNPRGISTNMENLSWKQEEEREVYTKYKELVAQPEEPTIIL